MTFRRMHCPTKRNCNRSVLTGSIIRPLQVQRQQPLQYLGVRQVRRPAVGGGHCRVHRPVRVVQRPVGRALYRLVSVRVSFSRRRFNSAAARAMASRCSPVGCGNGKVSKQVVGVYVGIPTPLLSTDCSDRSKPIVRMISDFAVRQKYSRRLSRATDDDADYDWHT